MRVYLDNAATTPLDEKVFEAMKPFYLEKFGNPSSIHSHGREVRSAIEKSRRKVADLLHTSPSEVFFTSGGTEADNLAIFSGLQTFGIKHIITSKLEHHAVLHAIEDFQQHHHVEISFVQLDEKGFIDYNHLEDLLKKNEQSLVSLMHGNNEIGNLTDITKVGNICLEYNAFFHSDTVQTVAHFPIDLSKTNVHAISASAHKFHGPKGVGFIYINNEHQLKPLQIGGGQERNMRGGTENVAGIVGLAKAMELAYEELDRQRNYILDLKKYTIDRLRESIPQVIFNGGCLDLKRSLYTVINIGLPGIEENDMLLFNLDINGISVSGGSACSSGTNIGSHVLEALNIDPDLGTIRISLSKFNTREEIDFALNKLSEICKVEA